MSSESFLVSVVMPAFNECESLISTVDEVAAALSECSFEIVLVDDGSTDDTWAVISELAERDKRVRGISFSRNFGHMAALHAGLLQARGDAVVTMDSDGQHPPAVLPEMIEKWRAGAAVVQGIRQAEEKIGFVKRITSFFFYRVFSWMADMNIKAGSADFRLLSRQVVDLALAHPQFALFLRGFVSWTGYTTEYIPVVFRARTAGRTKYSFASMLSFARNGIVRFSTKPLRLATYLGLLTCGISLAYLGYIVVTRLFSDNYVPGWASMAGISSLVGGIQLLVIGILGEYISVIFDRQIQKPPFVIERRQENPKNPD